MIMLLNPSKRKSKSFKRGGWRCRITKKCYRAKPRKRRGSRRRRSPLESGFAGHRKSYVAPSSSSSSDPWGYIPQAANGRRRRRRGRNASFNYRRKRSRNTYWVPAFARNPSGVIGASTKAFDTHLIKSALPVIGGIITTRIITEKLAGLGFVPSMLKSGVGGYVLSLFGAGVSYVGAKAVAPKYARSVLMGGAIYTMTQVLSRYVFPMLGFSPMLTGMGSYLTVSDARNARPLSGLESYLTVADAKDARPLSGLEHMTTEELAGLSYGGMSAVDGVASEELDS